MTANSVPDGRVAGISKLPEVTLAFWVMKISATKLGEIGGDLFSMTLKIGYVYSSIFLVAILASVLAGERESLTL